MSGGESWGGGVVGHHHIGLDKRHEFRIRNSRALAGR